MYEYYCGVSDYTPRLSHHGIKGMKWGIRRFQNPDGTLTEEGKRRYGRSVERGRQLREQGRTPAKELAKMVIGNFVSKVGVDVIYSSILNTITDNLTPAALASPEYAAAIAAGKVAVKGIKAGISLYNVIKTTRNLRDMDLSDNTRMSDDEVIERTKRLKDESDYQKAVANLRDTKKNNESGGKGANGKDENPWLKFAKEKANKYVNTLVDKKITQVIDDKFKKPEKYSDIEKMLKNPNKYSDSDWEKVSKKAEAISKSLTAVQNIDKNKKAKSLAYKYVNDSTFRTKLKDFYKTKETKTGEEAVDKILDNYDIDKV